MNDYEFELGIENLLRSERKRMPYYLESVEQERFQVIMSFYDHYASLSEMTGITSVDDFLGSLQTPLRANEDTDEDWDVEDALIGELHELIQKDIEKFPVLLSGEMSVTGAGVVMHDTDPQEEEGASVMAVDEIEEGMVVSGDIHHYVVAPMIAYETFTSWRNDATLDSDQTNDSIGSTPGLWLRMTNVTVVDVAGQPISTFDSALIPMNYPSMRFHKIVRQNASAERMPKAEEVKAPIITHFKGDFITGIFTDKENDLNYGSYSDDELKEAREAHELEIGIYMSAVEQDEPLTLTALNSISINGDEEGFANKMARYVASVFMKPRDNWRVIHAFLVEHGDEMLLRHVLPEDIIDIQRKDEE